MFFQDSTVTLQRSYVVFSPARKLLKIDSWRTAPSTPLLYKSSLGKKTTKKLKLLIPLGK